ncbi:hypothetical protein V8G54_007357 [Vigna mungo]|uniref:Uncharacterized protein n=1 Tax=Vigna mungo TaxID=3915 RepID=A0AAQ3P351_VIGMU
MKNDREWKKRVAVNGEEAKRRIPLTASQLPFGECKQVVGGIGRGWSENRGLFPLLPADIPHQGIGRGWSENRGLFPLPPADIPHQGIGRGWLENRDLFPLPPADIPHQIAAYSPCHLLTFPIMAHSALLFLSRHTQARSLKFLFFSPPQTTQCWDEDDLQGPHAGDDRAKARRRHDCDAAIARRRCGKGAVRARRKLLHFAERASTCCSEGFVWGFLGSLLLCEASVYFPAQSSSSSSEIAIKVFVLVSSSISEVFVLIPEFCHLKGRGSFQIDLCGFWSCNLDLAILVLVGVEDGVAMGFLPKKSASRWLSGLQQGKHSFGISNSHIFGFWLTVVMQVYGNRGS